MKRALAPLAASLLIAATAPDAAAQLTVAKDGPIVYGHHHLNTSNIEAEKKFFVETLGGRLVTVGTNNTEIVEFPNVLIFFRAQAPTGGTRGTTANHIGFSVPNLRPVVDKVKANGFKMISSTEARGREVTDDIAGPRGEGRHRRAAAAGRCVDRLRSGSRRSESRVRRGEAADDPHPAASRPLLQPEEHRDAGVVREDVRCRAAIGRCVSVGAAAR